MKILAYQKYMHREISVSVKNILKQRHVSCTHQTENLSNYSVNSRLIAAKLMIDNSVNINCHARNEDA